MLLIENETNELKAVLLDHNDYNQIKHILLNDQEHSTNTGDLKLCLYSVNGDKSFIQGRNRFNIQQLEKNPRLSRWLVQAKFFNGESHYHKNERTDLEDWLKSYTTDELKAFEVYFSEKILANKQRSKKDILLAC